MASSALRGSCASANWAARSFEGWPAAEGTTAARTWLSSTGRTASPAIAWSGITEINTPAARFLNTLGTPLKHSKTIRRYRFELNELPDYQDIVQREFDQYIIAQHFTGDQIRFLRAVQSVLLRKRRLLLADLYYELPLPRFGQDAVQRFFTEAQTAAMLTFLDSLAIAE